MTKYSLSFKKSVTKDLRNIPKQDIAKILHRIESLITNPIPEGSEKLSGQHRYRIRQGNYRILYEIEDLMLCITVVKIGHRRDVYRT